MEIQDYEDSNAYYGALLLRQNSEVLSIRLKVSSAKKKMIESSESADRHESTLAQLLLASEWQMQRMTLLGQISAKIVLNPRSKLKKR